MTGPEVVAVSSAPAAAGLQPVSPLPVADTSVPGSTPATAPAPTPTITLAQNATTTANNAAATGVTQTANAAARLARRRTRSMSDTEEIPSDIDAARWAEMVRQRRATRKRRNNDDDDQVLVGTRISEGHQNWVVAYNMLTGIRVATSRCNAKIDRPLTPADFWARHKLTFDLAGNELTPSARYDFKFKDYAPWVFRNLRQLFHIDAADYLVSLTGKYILSELGSPGKSGSFFYFSRDYRFIIKTLRHAEHRFLRSILKHYYEHVKRNPNTIISQFYGLHRVKTRFGKRIHFVVMNNLFPPHMDIHKTFDLKGSTVGRLLHDDGKQVRGTMKDLNWLQRAERLKLGQSMRDRFIEQVSADVELLAKLNIMDYSLLLGIHSIAPPVAPPPASNALVRTPSVSGHAYRHRDLRRMVTPHQGTVTLASLADTAPPAASDEPPISEGMRHNIFYQFEGGLRSTEDDGRLGHDIYYLGIIDLLTTYGTRKRLENFVKGLGHGTDFRKQISAVPPINYAKRFRDFISAMTKSEAELQQGRVHRTSSALNLAAAQRELEREEYHGSPTSPTREYVLGNVRNVDGTIVPAISESSATQQVPSQPLEADSGVANSLDCLAEEEEPSRESSATRQPVEPMTNGAVAPPIDSTITQSLPPAAPSPAAVLSPKTLKVNGIPQSADRQQRSDTTISNGAGPDSSINHSRLQDYEDEGISA